MEGDAIKIQEFEVIWCSKHYFTLCFINIYKLTNKFIKEVMSMFTELSLNTLVPSGDLLCLNLLSLWNNFIQLDKI